MAQPPIYISINLVLPLWQLRKQPRRRTFLPEPETAAERSAKVAMSEAGNGTGALYVLMDAIRDACRLQALAFQMSSSVTDYKLTTISAVRVVGLLSFISKSHFFRS